MSDIAKSVISAVIGAAIIAVAGYFFGGVKQYKALVDTIPILKEKQDELSNSVAIISAQAQNNGQRVDLLNNEIAGIKSTLPSLKKLTCEINRKSSNLSAYATTAVDIPANRISEGYVRVGGGCEIERGGKPGIPHNATMLKSIPTDKGWSCAAGDPPNVPLPTRIEAHVVYCKLG